MKPFSVLLLIVLAMPVPASSAWVNVTAGLAGKSCACGQVYCLVAVPKQSKIVLGICGGLGLFATTDNGTSWQALGSSSNWVDPQSIVFDASNPDIFWESGIHGGSVHKTIDGGSTFTVLPNSSSGDGLGVDMSDPLRRTIVVGSHESSGLHKSTDGGNTWTDITAGTSGWTSFPVVIDSQTFVEGSSNGGGIYRTVNGGAAWTKVSSASLNDGGALLAPDGSMYFLSSGEAAMIMSTNRGATWTTLAKPASAGNWDAPILMPDGSIVTIGPSTLLQCSDGKTWKSIGSTLPSTGLSEGSIAYNGVTQSFFMSFWNCNTTVPTNAVWEQSFTTATLGERASMKAPHAVSREPLLVIARGARASMSSYGSADMFDLFGRKLQPAELHPSGILVARSR